MDSQPVRLGYVNGSYVPETQSGVSIFDYGLLYGQTVFEYTRTFNLKPFRLDKHIERIFNSMKYSGINCGMSPDELTAATLDTIDKNLPTLADGDEFTIWHNITAGLRDDYAQFLPKNMSGPRILINVFPLSITRPWVWEQQQEGAPAVITHQRSTPAHLLDPKVKNRSRLYYRLAEIEAARTKPGSIALLTDQDGYITEGTSSNFMLVKDGQLVSPRPKNILRGVTRAVLIDIAQSLGVPFVEDDIDKYDAITADEAFFCSTSYIIMPVKSLDEHIIGDGQIPGAITKKLADGFSDLVGIDFMSQGRELTGLSDFYAGSVQVPDAHMATDA